MDRAVVSRESFPLANFCEALRLSFAAWVQCNSDRLNNFLASILAISKFICKSRSSLTTHVESFNQSPDC